MDGKQELESLSTETGGCKSDRMEARTQEERIRHKMKGRKYVLAFLSLQEWVWTYFWTGSKKFSLGQSYQNESERKSEALSSSPHHLSFLLTPSISILFFHSSLSFLLSQILSSLFQHFMFFSLFSLFVFSLYSFLPFNSNVFSLSLDGDNLMIASSQSRELKS